MRKILETLRLREQLGFNTRQIAEVIKASPTTVSDYLRRAEMAGIEYAVGVQMGHQWLEERLFPPKAPASVKRPQPNWAYIHTELKRKHVTLDLLWREYKQAHPDGLEYSSFCENYKKWAGKVDVSMRQHHAPADKLFVDYAGATIDVVDPEQAYRACVGILRHINTHGKEALEQACELALQINSANYRSISSILKTGKAKPVEQQSQQTLLPEHHSNVRGADYYH